MKIQAICPGCQTTITVAAENAGKRARCPKCGGTISIPGAAPSQSPPAPPGKSQPESPPRQARRASADEGERPPARNKSAPQRRRKQPAADDIWAQPLSSYSSPAIEEEEFEALGITSNRGKYNPRTGKREVGNQDDPAPSYKVPLIMAAIGLGSALLFGGIGLAFPPAALAGAGIGGVIGTILSLWGGLKILSNAFEDSPLTGFLYLICGPYALYFLFSRWDINQHPFIINLLGTVVLIVSIAVGGLAGVEAGAAN